MNKKLLSLLCAGLLTVSLVGCSSTEEEAVETTPETSTEEQVETSSEGSGSDFTGEKVVEIAAGPGKSDVVITTVTFENGNPTDVNIDVETSEGMKSELAASGEYVMVEGGTPWNEQIDALEDFIVENKFDLSKVTLSNEDGNTDAVSGVSIKVSGYFAGIEEAIAQVSDDYKGFTGDVLGKVETEEYTNVAVVTFEEGKPVAVNIDTITEDGKKSELSESGEYDMGEGTTAWHEQVQSIESFIVENNFDLSKVTVSDEGKTDAVSGVSIAVPGYIEAVQVALDQVK